MESHVQMPKGMIKRFAFKDGYTWCYSFPDKAVSRPSARKLNAVAGFYSDTLEKEINETIETPFLSVTQKLHLMTNPNHFNGITSAERTAITRFYSSIFARFQDLEEEYKSIFDTSASNHDKAFHFFQNNNLNNFFIQFYISLCFNHSGVPFFLPQTGMASFLCGKRNSLVLFAPVFPDFAIVFEKPSNPANYQPILFELDQADIARHINLLLTNTQRKIDGWIICPDKNELEQIVSKHNS